MPPRASEQHDDIVHLIGTENRVQTKEREAAGARMAQVSFSLWTFASIPCEIKQTKRSGRCVGAERWRKARKRRRSSPSASNLTGEAYRCAELRRGNSAISLRLERKNKKDRIEDARGYLWAASNLQEGLGFDRGEAMARREAVRDRLEEEDDMWPPHVSEGEGEDSYRFGTGRVWAVVRK
jgi:hypothetical protein